MTNARVRSAVDQLRQYYGIGSNNPYVRLRRATPDSRSRNRLLSEQPTVLDEFVDFVQPHGSVVKDFMDRVTTKSGTAPGVQSILERCKALKSDDGTMPEIPMLVTPYVESSTLAEMQENPLANSPVNKSTRQGARLPENGSFYTFDDASINASSERKPRVSVLQLFSPVNSQSATDTDIAAL